MSEIVELVMVVEDVEPGKSLQAYFIVHSLEVALQNILSFPWPLLRFVEVCLDLE